jgi:hypothetical protein
LRCIHEKQSFILRFQRAPRPDEPKRVSWEKASPEPLALADYETAIREARSRGIMGGGIYDSLHATFARRKQAVQIVMRNPSHFQHVAPDIEILTPEGFPD